VHLDTGVIAEVEALVRWEHPTRGLVAPADFIPLAEETGMIIAIGRWVLTEACRQVRQWQLERPSEPPLLVSVNLSGRQFQHPEDSAIVNTIITLAKTLNLTVVGEGIETIAQLDHLRALGCDRGQGYYFAKPRPAEVTTSETHARAS